jgi:hypothetical protein
LEGISKAFLISAHFAKGNIASVRIMRNSDWRNPQCAELPNPASAFTSASMPRHELALAASRIASIAALER